MNNFVNAQDMQKLYPRTFDAPSKTELKTLKVGNVVKVSHNKERFWTEIVEIKENNIKARVDNDLILKQPFKYGDIIKFKKENIYTIFP